MKSRFRSFLVFLLLLPYTASYSDSGGSISVRNATEMYLHIIVGGDPHLYVAPGGSISVSSEAGTHFISAFYSPGQGIAGVADTILSISRVETQTADCQGNECNSSNCSSESESEHSTSYTSATWTVRPEALAGGGE